MNREIKFRVWDKMYKQFLPIDSYGIITTDFKAFGVMLRDFGIYKEGEYFYFDAQHATQFTGLQDKNGKDIYEGDIVKIDAAGVYDEGLGVFEWFEFITNNDKWTRGGEWRLATKCHQVWTGKTIEVIGNIFENLELIQK